MADPNTTRPSEPEPAPAAPARSPGKSRDALTAKARARELERQEGVIEAVAKAGTEDLPKLGGPLLEPGLGR